MPFQKGHTLSPGRAVGSTNKRTRQFRKLLEEKGFSPGEALMYIYDEAMKNYEMYRANVASGRYSPMEDNGVQYLKIAADMAKEIARYQYPKLRTVEINTMNPLNDMSSDQKLEAAKQLVNRLEIEMKNEPENGTG